PGADTMLATRAFLEMHDGHSLLFTTHSTFTVVPLLHTKVPYDPVGDVRPLSRTFSRSSQLLRWASARCQISWASRVRSRPASISMRCRERHISLIWLSRSAPALKQHSYPTTIRRTRLRTSRRGASISP